ncbi:hypothetical protein ACOCJ7_07095 [Knoellia sp. CPCC 206453]|uniref:hypothetical protein n=1 Tax=Knoellia pratensis TaxID=3404796 RepID=UPI00361A5C96
MSVMPAERVTTTAPMRIGGLSDSQLEDILDEVLDEKNKRDPLEHLYEIKEGARLWRSLCGRMWVPPFGIVEGLAAEPVLALRGDCPDCAEVAIRNDTQIVERRPDWLS